MFGSLARLAFTAELGWLAHEDGDYRTATEQFSNAVQGIGSFPEQTDRFFRSLRMRVGHVIAWLSQGACENEGLATPFSGLIANFDEPVDELLAKPGAPQPMLWASLAEYAALVGETNDSHRFIRRVRTVDGRQFYLAALQSADALFLSNLLEGRLQAGMRAGIEYARILTLGGAVLRDREPDSLVATEAIDLNRLFEQNSSVITEKCYETVPTFVLAPLFMGACARKDIPQPNFAHWRRQISAAFGTNEHLSKAVELLQTGFRAVLDEEEEAIRIVRHLTANPTELYEYIRILPLVISCAVNAPDLRQLLTFQVSVLLDHARRLRGTWAALYCRMVAAKWRIIAETQPFRFVAPRLMTDAIIRACSPQLFGPPDCARLLLVAAQAVGVRWSADTLERLNLMSSRPSG